MDKKTLRQLALKKRASYMTDAICHSVVLNILNSSDFKKANHIALYYPIKNEVDITPILKAKDKTFYFPRCIDNNLEFAKGDAFVKGKFGIKEPSGEKINPKILDLIYVPALMVNKACYRLGYGKGYYDRFFRNNSIKAKKIAILPSCLISDEFVQDSFDMPLDSIICEKEIIC